jgi:hypothetical protein
VAAAAELLYLHLLYPHQHVLARPGRSVQQQQQRWQSSRLALSARPQRETLGQRCCCQNLPLLLHHQHTPQELTPR